ncbi:cytochrome c family protein [Desulfoplanes formicivorans]|uniref:Cytochrome c554 n=1 Tax=Desulfoplanes formicivorans TaxID=1592317 RepID=A0A194AJU1_9BACT|nr:cytochrome c family protein [Desulfoplanes formicivorans]GAU09510.1 cytochrome c554 [Desulfoplanes formicivorans]
MNRLYVLLCAVVVNVCIVSFAQAEFFGEYVGVKACADCHEAKVHGWMTTPHARAFADLAEQGEEKQTTPGCVKCHVVAMEAEGGFIDMDLTPELINVQCESCHGPGARHVESEDPGDIIRHPDEASCRTCHTPGQDKNFNYAIKSKFVHGERCIEK